MGSTGCLRVWPGRRGQLRTRTTTRAPLILTPFLMPRNVMFRLLAATPTRPPTQLRVRTTLTTERTPAGTAPSAGTPTTPSSSPDTETQSTFFWPDQDLRVSPSTVIVTEYTIPPPF